MYSLMKNEHKIFRDEDIMSEISLKCGLPAARCEGPSM